MGGTLCARRLPLFPEEYFLWAPDSQDVPGIGRADVIIRLVSFGANDWRWAGQLAFPQGTVRFPWLLSVLPDEH